LVSASISIAAALLLITINTRGSITDRVSE
jgi:hypothetical protein